MQEYNKPAERAVIEIVSAAADLLFPWMMWSFRNSYADRPLKKKIDAEHAGRDHANEEAEEEGTPFLHFRVTFFFPLSQTMLSRSGRSGRNTHPCVVAS